MTAFITDDQRSARMSAQRSKDTGPELALRRALHARGLRFYVHRRPVPTLRRTADIVFPRRRTAVFVDGCFWHGCPLHGNMPSANAWYWPDKIRRNRERDLDTDRSLKLEGWSSVRIWEHQTTEEAVQLVVTQLVADCDSRSNCGVNGQTNASNRLSLEFHS